MTVIDEYLHTLSAPERTALQHIRSIVHNTVPEAVETFSYGIPTLKYKCKNLIHFSAFKNHLSLFPGGQATTAFTDRLSDYKTFKGTIQFTLDNPIPDDLLTDIISFCKTVIDAK